MLNASAPQISTVIQSTVSVGAKVPTGITKAYARYEKITKASQQIYVGGNALTVATLKALDEDPDPASDIEVQRILASQSAGQEGVTAQVRAIVLGDLVSALAVNADDLIDAWRKPFEDATKDIESSAKALGPIELANAEEILRKGGDAAAQWTKASQANHRIDSIVSSWTTLAQQTGFVPDGRNTHMLKFTDPTLDQWEDHRLHGRRLSAWDAHALGLPLNLADGATYMERTRSLEQQSEARDRMLAERGSGKLPTRDRAQMVQVLSAYGTAARAN